MRSLPVSAYRAAGIAALGCACLVIAPLASHAVDAATTTGTETGPLKVRMAEYRKKLAEYNKAYDAYDKVAGPYWRTVTDKRSRRRTRRSVYPISLGQRQGKPQKPLSAMHMALILTAPAPI